MQSESLGPSPGSVRRGPAERSLPLHTAVTLRLSSHPPCTASMSPQAAQALENAVDGLGSDTESGAAAGMPPRKRKGKPFPEVHIPARPGMKTVSASPPRPPPPARAAPVPCECGYQPQSNRRSNVCCAGRSLTILQSHDLFCAGGGGGGARARGLSCPWSSRSLPGRRLLEILDHQMPLARARCRQVDRHRSVI